MAMKRAGTNRRRSIGAVLIVCAIVFLVTVMMHSPGRLLDRAKRIAWAPEQSSPRRFGPGRGAHYMWLSDDTALGLTYVEREDHAFLLNAATGQQIPVQPLEEAFKTITPSGEQHLSADGTWLLWTGVRNAMQYPSQHGKRYVLPVPGRRSLDSFRAVATSLDGSGQVDFQQGNDLAWLPGTDGWVRFLWGSSNGADRTGLQVQRLHGSGKVSIPLPRLPMAQGEVRVLGSLKNGHLMVCSLPVQGVRSRAHADLYEISYDVTPPSIRTYLIVAPTDCNLLDVTLAPLGDRLAWKTAGSRKPYPDWVRPIIPSLKPVTVPVIGLWVSKVDGSGLHKIGDVDAPLIDGWDLHLYDISWTPSGKHLSFIFNNALWMVPVD